MKTTDTIHDLSFCSELMDLYHSNLVTGRNGKEFTNLGSLSTINNLLTLRRLLMDAKPKRTLEIGLAFGGSYLTMTSSLREFGLSPNRQHIAIDPYQSIVWDDVALRLGEQAGLDGYLNFQSESSSLALPKLLQSGLMVDLIYVDGSHLFEDVFIDYYYSFQLLSQDGLLLFDDSQDRHVKKVIQFIRQNMSHFLLEVDMTPYHPENNSTKFTFAKMLNRTQLTGFRKIRQGNREWNAKYFDF